MCDAGRLALRDAAEYRSERLASERQTLERRKAWAARRLDVFAMERLERQLIRLRSEEMASTEPRGKHGQSARSVYCLRYHSAGRWPDCR